MENNKASLKHSFALEIRASGIRHRDSIRVFRTVSWELFELYENVHNSWDISYVVLRIISYMSR